MRIAIYDPYLDSLSGGEKYMLTAAACLADRHEVFLLWDALQIKEYAEKKFQLDLSRIKVAKNIFSSQVSFLQRIQESRKYDVIFYLSDGSIPIVASKKLFLHFQFPVQWVKGKSLKNILKMKRVTGIICNSFFTKEHIDKTFGITTSNVIYPPASGESVSINIRKEHMILTVGRFSLLRSNETFKKQEVLIDVFKKMIDEGLKNWQFVLVVSFPLHDEEKAKFLKDRIKGYPIKIVMNASSEDVDSLYAKAKIYWHASGFKEDLQKHPEFAEHFGISTVQAMERGAIPVVIDAGGQKEIVENGKNGFLWNTEKELIQETKKIITDEKLLKNLSQSAKEKSVAFSKEIFCSNIHTIIT